MGYPKKTLGAIAASLAAGGIGAYIIASLVVGTITAQNINVTNVTATGTVSGLVLAAPTANLQQANITNENVTGTSNIATASTTNLIVGQGTTLKGIVSGTATVDPDSVAAQACTSTSITLSNLKVTDSVDLNVPSTWVTSTLDIIPVAASGAVTVNICNNALTADNLPSGALRATGFIY